MLKKIFKFFIVFVILFLTFFFFFIMTSSIPSNLLKENVKEASNTLYKEGNRKIIYIADKLKHVQFDNYSDALMINTAYSIDSKAPLYSLLTAKKNYIPNKTKQIKQDKVGELESNSKYEFHDEVSELRDTVNGEAEESFEYAKYWHGYLIFLRPLLLFFNYFQIRIILITILVILAILLIYLIAKKINKTIAVIILFGLVQIEYFYIGFSILNSITMIIAIVSCIVLLKKFDKIKDFSLYFFIIGIFLGFFSLLDIPFMTFGFPIMIYFLLKQKNSEVSVKEQLVSFVKYGFFWLLGYGLIWIFKWILIDILYGRNIFITSIGQVLYRSVGQKNSGIFAIGINVLNMVIPFALTLFLFEYVLIRYCKKITKENAKKAIPFFILGIMPIFWYAMLANHSTYHYFFTYRILFLSIVCSLIGIYITCGEPED